MGGFYFTGSFGKLTQYRLYWRKFTPYFNNSLGLVGRAGSECRRVAILLCLRIVKKVNSLAPVTEGAFFFFKTIYIQIIIF